MIDKLRCYIERKTRDIKYSDAINNAAAIINSRTFADIKNCNMGKEVVLCGAGPTLKDYKPINGAIHVAINSAFVKEDVKFDWIIVCDYGSIKKYEDELSNYDCIKFFGHQIPDLSLEISESYRIKANARRFYTDSHIADGFSSRFVCDIDCMPLGNMPNIALLAMQIILFSNPTKIYLAGCDASSLGHFDDIKKNDGKHKNIYVDSDQVIQKWMELKEFARAFYPDTEIVSVNPVGLKGLFTDEYY